MPAWLSNAAWSWPSVRLPSQQFRAVFLVYCLDQRLSKKNHAAIKLDLLFNVPALLLAHWWLCIA
jgi:hypothetical protein